MTFASEDSTQTPANIALDLEAKGPDHMPTTAGASAATASFGSGVASSNKLNSEAPGKAVADLVLSSKTQGSSALHTDRGVRQQQQSQESSSQDAKKSPRSPKPTVDPG